MDRRKFLHEGIAASAILMAAGCLGDGDGGGGNGDGNGDGSPTATDEDVVTIGSDIPYRPFEYYNEQDELVGFDPGIAEAVFKGEMGREYEFKKTAWDGIIQSLNNGNFRVIMSAMTITEERAEKVDFSDPYFTAYQTIVVLENSDITAKEDLKGKNVGVQKGTTGAAAAEELKSELDGDLDIKKFDQIQGAFDALLNNQVSAVINDNTVNAEFVEQKSEDVRFVEGEGEAAEQGKDAPPYLTLTVEEYGIAFRQNDDDFRKKVNDALAAIKESGKYDEIYSEYFSG